MPFFSVPIILNLILLFSNLLGSFGAILQIRRLLFPWLIFYFLTIVSTLSLLVYIIVILQNNWLRVILFLVVVPLLVLATSFWSVIFRLARRIRAAQRKVIPRTVKIPVAVQHSSSVVDHPVPIRTLAISPPEAAWDPEYLIERDPRYLVGHGGGGAGSEVDSYQESSFYGEDFDSYAARGGSGAGWGSGEDTDYLSDEYTDRDGVEDTEDLTESEQDIKEAFEYNEHYTDTDNLIESDEEIPETLHVNYSFEGDQILNKKKASPMMKADELEMQEIKNMVSNF